MTKKSSTPAIRFKGFTDTWEQRELWELTIWDKKFNEVEAEKQPKIVKYPYVLADVFSKIEDASGDVRLLSTGNYIGYTTDEKAGKNLCVGEVVAIPWGGVPNIKYYKGKFVTADNRIATSNDTETLGNRFLSLYLEHSLAFLQSIYRGASIKHPSMNDVLSMQISIPHIQEQREIETWFANLDNLITLHQRKYDKLTNVKKSMLEKMFPKNGSNVPEIRFKGFTEAWEQRKFADVVQIERGGSPRPIDDYITDSPNGLNWVKIGDAPAQGHYITKTAEKIRPEGLSKTREVHPGDLILSNSMSFGKPYIMGIDGCIHDGWLLIRDINSTFDLTFLCHLLGTPQMLDQYRSLAAGSTVNNLNKELVGNTVVTIPQIDEQRVLGQYLERLDNLITLHQRELEKLKNLKKACLEKMFV